MSSWDYINIGASAFPEHKKYVKQIFKYIGFGECPAGGDGAYEKPFFDDPEIFCCRYSNWESISGHIEKSFYDMQDEDLLNLLNALFPSTRLYVRHASGNDTSDSWENTDKVYDPGTMTCYCGYSVTNYDVGPNGKEKWTERIALEPPKQEYVEALIKISTQEKNEELTSLLLELLRKLRNGEIVYKDDPTDKRIIGKIYDATQYSQAQMRRLVRQYFKLAEKKQHIEFAGKKFFIGGLADYYDRKIRKDLNGIITDTLDDTVDYVSFGITDYDAEDDFDELYESISNAIAIAKKNPHIKLISKENLNSEIMEALKLRRDTLLRGILDSDAPIVFRGRHFVFRELTYEEKCEEKIIDQVIKMGGVCHDDPVKKLDYFVIGDWLWCEYSKSVLKVLEWREKGSGIKFVTTEMIRQVLNNGKLLDEMERRAEEEEIQQAEQLVKLQAEEARIAEEEKQRKKEEKERLKAEKKQQAEQEKAEAERQKAQLRKQETERREEEIKAEKEQKEAKRQADLERARANAVILYAPGEEPERLHNRIQTLMAKLDETYPDHVIVNLGKDHKHWDETVTELYKALGYADRSSFLEAYGFKVNSDKGGRPATLDPDAVIAELKRRYPEGTDMKVAELTSVNKDLPIKTLSNNATALFGMGLGKYLKDQGILLEKKPEAGYRNKRKSLEKEAIALEMERLKQEAQELAELRKKHEEEGRK